MRSNDISHIAIGLILELDTRVNCFFYFYAQLVRSTSCAEFQWVPRTESLKSKKLPELQEMAKSSGIKKITGLKKMELIYQIIDTVASTPNEEKSKQSSIKEEAEHTFSSPYSQKKEASMHEKSQTKGEIKDGNWVINGQKIWTSTAQYSQMMFCLVRTEPQAPKHSGISFILIPMDTPGIEIRPLVDMTLDAGFNEVFFTDVTVPEENIVGKRGDGWSVANSVLGHERGSLADPNATMNRLNTLINMMKEETIDGRRLIDIPSYRDRLMQVQGKVMASQAHSLRLLSSKINPSQNVKLGGMIQKLVGTELRHELEGLAIDVLGEIGTLYEETPRLKENGSFQFTYMYFLGLIIGGGTNQIQKNIISERGLGMPKEPKVQEASSVSYTHLTLPTKRIV